MKSICARPPYYGRRVKLILICLMLAASVLLGHGAAVCAGEASASEGAVGRTNLIRTTGLADAYSVFECSGTTISAKGLYARDRLRKMFIYNHEDESGGYSIHAGKDGSYTAELNMSLKNGSYRLALRFESGALMLYKVYFNEQSGWYFPLNGLERTNREVFGHIFEAPAEASALYLSANNDPGEINTALEQIERYALSITEGLDDDLEKARAISRFISGAFYYDEDARDTDAGLDTIALYNVLKSGRTVCGGFANLFCAMAEAIGLDAVNIKGGVVGGGVTYETLGDGVQNHEWAAFWYEKEQRWIWADPCWDGAGSYKAGEFEAGDPKEMYIDAGDVALSFNHRADKAERRHYFAAKPETSPVGISGGAGETADTGETAATAAAGAELLPAAESEAAAVTSAAAPAVRPTVAEKEDNTVLIVMIAVLGALTLAAAVIVAITIKNGRKKLKMVVIELENGKKIKLELYPEIAPISAANFENLVRKGFYDGLTFHRVIPGFMIQGGCPNGNGTGSSGERIKGEFAANGVPNDLKHTRGVLSMARAADPNSASCQFFIMHKDAPHLDGSYAAFGKVVEGIEVVDEIAAVETDYADKPVTPVVMKRVYIEE